MDEDNRSTEIKNAFEEHLLKVLRDGEQVIVADEDGTKREVREEPSAAFLGVVRAYLKDSPPPAAPVAPGKRSEVLDRFAKKLPFATPSPSA